MSNAFLKTALIVTIAMGICGLAWYYSQPAPAMMRHDQEILIQGTTLQLEIARTPAAITRGLSGRKTMAENEGMLFIMPNVEYQNFWMKDMHFAIDIVFLREGRVVDAVTLDPPSLLTIPSHKSKTEADMVLELRAGRAKELGLTEGVITTINELR